MHKIALLWTPSQPGCFLVGWISILRILHSDHMSKEFWKMNFTYLKGIQSRKCWLHYFFLAFFGNIYMPKWWHDPIFSFPREWWWAGTTLRDAASKQLSVKGTWYPSVFYLLQFSAKSIYSLTVSNLTAKKTEMEETNISLNFVPLSF